MCVHPINNLVYCYHHDYKKSKAHKNKMHILSNLTGKVISILSFPSASYYNIIGNSMLFLPYCIDDALDFVLLFQVQNVDKKVLLFKIDMKNKLVIYHDSLEHGIDGKVTCVYDSKRGKLLIAATDDHDTKGEWKEWRFLY